MIKKIYYTMGLFTTLLVAGCGESLEETYDEFSGDGMIRYIGKCSDVEVNPGWERLQVVWKHSIDAGVKKVKITWQSEKESGEMFAEPCSVDSNDLMDTVYIESLSDAMYTVRVNNVAADGRESLIEEKYGRPYSFEHEDLRSFSRGVSAFSRMGDKLAVLIDQDNENIKEMLLCFKDKTGKEHTWDIKAHAQDTLSYLYYGYKEVTLGRDYLFLLPEDDGVKIDFAQPITIRRKGKLQGCVDEINFQDETLNINEKLWSTEFSQLLLGTYGEDWESKVDHLTTLELDYNMTTLQDLMYFPNLKKVILGKNRYMDTKYTNTEHSTTDEYIGLVMLQFLKDTRDDFTVERYNNHYFYQTDGMNLLTEAYKEAGKLTDLTFVEKGSSNLEAKPRYTPLDTTGWKVTCSDPDSVRDGYTTYGAAWLLYDEFRTTSGEYYPGHPEYGTWTKTEEMYFEPKQTLGAAVITVTFDMKENKKVEGFKVGQVISKTEDKDKNYLPSALKIEFSADGIIWTNATYTDGSATIGNSIGEETFIPVPKELQTEARYIRLTMNNRPVDDVSNQGLYNLRLAKFIPCTVEQ